MTLAFVSFPVEGRNDVQSIVMKQEEKGMNNTRIIMTAISNYIGLHGNTNTREIISLFAARFSTPKRRIAGILGAMKHHYASIQIITYVPRVYSEAM